MNQIIVMSPTELQALIVRAVQIAVQQVSTPQKNETQYPEYLNIEECASMLNLAKPTLYAMVSRGEIPYIKKTKRLYFRKDALIKWLEDSKTSVSGSKRTTR